MPHYQLEYVRIAAKDDKIRYSRNALKDIDNLGYTVDDICSCLMSLVGKDFYKTYLYAGKQYDAYRTHYAKPSSNNIVDLLYIKFRLTNDYITIDLASFHLDR